MLIVETLYLLSNQYFCTYVMLYYVHLRGTAMISLMREHRGPPRGYGEQKNLPFLQMGAWGLGQCSENIAHISPTLSI